MPQSRKDFATWVGRHVLPHERDVRAWLRRSGNSAEDVDDVVQEVYCRLAALSTTAQIENGRAYFFRTARNIVLEKVRRAQVVSIEFLAEIDDTRIVREELSPERVVSARLELRRLQAAIEGLPVRCREVFQLRRVYGVPQREVARLLGLTESVVEMQTIRGLKLVLKSLASEELPNQTPSEGVDETARPRDDRRGGGRLGGARR